ncbi:mitochondrial ribosomal protein S15 [Gloeophyllum trabeum ATCC 11539]|uniref:Mitochondrial ribosomal protein S15 n=1 Tax=Gloeophyllum trabeum (strain ATCC 11539 / FP-39264 / Madison 617) TaxID=670483 RepID=S7RYL9_GLOTA|nr:mitochondrial ribosomal protein S15 [Gloeophyllum trabeum ATCC 11539]EPQ60025.1 mitochondrial ribosomal protein S15 [Gloeophyllum trabeum ATCC 11539]
MLRSCFSQSSRAVASSSTCTRAGLHTSAVWRAEGHRERTARQAKKANLEQRAERQRLAQATRPHVVLGTRPGDESKWSTCDLAKVLVTEEQLLASPAPQLVSHPLGELRLPPLFQFGVREEEKRLLFETLPVLSAEAATTRNDVRVRRAQNSRQGADPSALMAEYQREMVGEVRKMNQMASLLDLRNTNAAGLAFENRKRVVQAFSDPRKPNDPGRPEVQAALLTMKIRNLWSHLTKYKRDVGNRRWLRKLVHQRAKILKYLKRLDRDRYEALLPRLALEPGSVEGELVV